MSAARGRFAPVLWAVVVLLTALPPLAAAYSSRWALAVLAGCVVLPFGLAALGRRARVPRWVVATAGIALAVVVALVFSDQVDEQSGALPGWRSSPGLTALGPLIDAVPRLLTAPRPAPPDPSLLVPAALFTWIAALAVATAVVGSRRAGVAPLVGATVVHVAGGLLTAGRGDLLGASALATAVALLVGWVLLPGPGSRRATTPEPPSAGTRRGASGARRRGVALASVAAVVAASFALVAATVPTARAFEPRTLVPPPQLPADATNPIPQAAVWASSPDEVLLEIEATAGALPERVALAVLPDYTGVAWTLDAELRAVGVVADADTLPGVATRPATYTLTAGGYDEVWVPVAGIATEVSGVGAVMDLDSGTVVAPSGWADEPVTVTSTITDPTDEAVARASVPQSSEVQRYLATPRAPAYFGDAAAGVTAGVSSRWEQVSLLADAVRTDAFRADATEQERVLDSSARSGSSYARLTQFLFDTPDEGGQVGTSEQFAAAFALLARTQGIPTRLVVGFDVPEADGDGPVPVTGASARVWAEVYLAQLGWVAVDPSPDSSITTDVPTPPGEEDLGDDATPDAEDDSPADEPAVESEDRGTGTSWSTVGIALAVVVVAVLGTVGLAIARAARRHRWRSRGERGAWAQVEDALVLSGSPPPAGRTATELAAALPDDARAAGVALAERAEADAFAPDGEAGPGRDGVSAWSLAREVEGELRRGSHAGRRLLWWLSPGVWRR